jgi:hypothetical protein
MKSWLLVLIAACTACAADSDNPSVGVPLAPGADAGSPVAPAADTGVTIIQDPAVTSDAGAAVVYSDAGAAGNGEKCVATKAVAPPPANPKIDIVWVVDSSQSMFDEQKRINMNLAAFTDAITKANLDVSIVMVSQSPALTGGIAIPLPGLCPILPPDPLEGNPFQKDPRYHFVQTYVNSPDPLKAAAETYPKYQQFLRPGSTVHFIVVTDDEAAYKGAATPDARATAFENDMKGLLNRGFRLHTISSPGPTPCTASQCDIDPNQGIVCVFLAANCRAANSGLTYYALAQRTQGLTASICETDWTKIFTTFQENIIKSAPLPCDYVIPPPPKGETLDPAKVNVGYAAPGATMDETLRKVADANACGMNAGWFYDQGKTKILLCPEACTKASQGGSMNIAFGCNTVVLE